MRLFLTSLVLLPLALCSASVGAATLLMDRPEFQRCEAEAFTALVIARNAMHLNMSQQSQLDVKSNGDFSVATIKEVYAEIDRSASRDHGGFAARKFYQCAKREGMDLVEDLKAAPVCLARQDIVFFVNAERAGARPQDEAGGRIKNLLSRSSQAVYPGALIDKLVPMVYRVQSDDDEYQLRQFVFETCLFPEDWNAWFKSVQTDKP
ncbi:hypothetical protein OOZ63_16525 [Paucibacter sp. PLA-PC-4]|uniref:hypothetical protein n=1 Tax=Paucibacter sp. PLA-PC-4 TaxID=2993655 RepID=UPI00224AB843|nr:hypothetical protein [Paucibacter sp. PLA-PC-4]MCX2863437.1 hypothetical protein [Paucibacter sp. PLA-PC-4]